MSSAELYEAIRDDDLDRCLALLSVAGATLANSTITIKRGFWMGPDDVVSPLMLAVMMKRAPIVNLLLARRADPNWTKTQGLHNDTTSVWIAADTGQAEVLRALAEHGANLETPDDDGITPARIAAERGHGEVMRVLHELGANLETPSEYNGRTPAWIAAFNGRAEVMRVLAELKVNLETHDRMGRTPAVVAAWYGHAEVARVLAESGVDLETPDKNGCTPAFAAARQGNAEVITELAKVWPHVIHQTVSWAGQPPISLIGMTVRYGNPEVVKALILLGAPATFDELQQRTNVHENAGDVRVSVHLWAADIIAQHRVIQGTFLPGCSAHKGGIALSKLGGGGCMMQVRALIGAYVGLIVGRELRGRRAVVRALEAGA